MTLGDEVRTLLSGKKKYVSSKLFSCNWIPITHAIMLAQISLCVFAWTFAGFMTHETIALPDNISSWIQNYSSDTQVIVTLLSTILALTSSFLLGTAVQYALVRRLSNAPLRLHTMVEWAKLAQRSISLNFDRRHLSWTLLSVSWIGLLSLLTTAWSSLLAPESVVIYYDLQGNETNFLSLPASNLPGSISPWNYRPSPGYNLTPSDIVYITTPFQDLEEALMNAGSCATSAKVSLNSAAANFISLYDSAYISNISTGGIYPTGNIATPPSSPYSGIGNPSYQGLSRTYNVTQHGFTADISCRMRTSNDPAITPESTSSDRIINHSNVFWSVDTYSWSTNCSSEIEYNTNGATIINDISSGSKPSGLLMASVCFGQNFTGPSNPSFLVLFDALPNSSYSAFGPQICQVTPLVTIVQTIYDQTGIINVIRPPLDQHSLPDPTSNQPTRISSFYPAFVIWGTFVGSQGPFANVMGEKLVVLHQAGANSSYTFELENYLRGMMEYLGSFMAMAVVANNSTGNSSSVVQFNGTVNVHTIGWTFHLRTQGPSLIAITLVTLLTVAAGAFAMMPVDHYEGASTNRRLQAASAHAFDPTAIIDVLLASSAGDLARVLSESDCQIGGKEDHHGHHGQEGLKIVLGVTNTGRPALRTVPVDDEETRASADVEHRGLLATHDDDRLGTNDADDESKADVADRDG
ncbi:hypothetical protein OG21DRAFT_1482657 [Imleria badia]|nr:hypothetical protein OG21DRAFT_1482657 [Imleria badia]